MKVLEMLRNKRILQLFGMLPQAHIYAISGLTLGLLAINIGADEKKSAIEEPQVLASGRLSMAIDIPDIQKNSNLPTEAAEPKLSHNDKKQTNIQASLKQNSTKITLPTKNKSLAHSHSINEIYRSASLQNNTPSSKSKILTVKPGDSLAKLFKKAGVNEKYMRKLLNDSSEAKNLTRIKPKQQFEFHTHNQKLTKLVYTKSPLGAEVFNLGESDTYEYQKVEVEPELRKTYRSGKIKQSLYLAGVKSKLDDELIMELASIFGWDIDFALDIRKGDEFKLLFEEKFLDNKKIGNGNILAAEFVNQGKSYKAVRYEDQNKQVSYYTPTGENMRKAFLRAPLDFRRISSNFNPKRLHPISKVVRPHRGTDYAAARGTPVWSSGNGRVIASGYTKANGNYIVIQHGNNIQTKYLHLHKRYASKGKRVKQKQVIGTVGSTGYSTAPHLHYEFLLNGVHRNPRTIVQKLPKAKSIPKKELHRFTLQTQPLVAALENNSRSSTKFAAAESSTKSL